MVYHNFFSSAILSRGNENVVNMDDYVVIENMSDEIDEVDGTIEKSIKSKYFTANKIEEHTYHTIEETHKENNLQYVRFNNECELNTPALNGKSNGEYHSESSSNSSSSESISFRRIVLTPIEENEVKISNGYDHLKFKLHKGRNYIIKL